MTAGDRIAYKFGSGNVQFGAVVDCNKSGAKLKTSSASNWTILFDQGDVHTFDCDQVVEGLALYEKIRARELSDPLRSEKLRKLKTAFLTQKESVEIKLPDRAKERFLTVGFARWEKRYLPVLFLGPYDVSPGSVRKEWLRAFEKRSSHTVPQIVYWLGSDPKNGFSILHEKDCLSLKKARLVELVKYKQGNTAMARRYNKALDELFTTLKKPLDSSRIPFVKTKERHELVCGPKADRLLAEI